jgi:integrase
MLTIDRLCEMHAEWAQTYYRKPKSGRLTGTLSNFADAKRNLCETRYRPPEQAWQVRIGHIPANQMSAKILYHIQQTLAKSQRLNRNTINGRINKIRQIFAWAAKPQNALIDEDIPVKLGLVEHLAYGRSAAKESDPVTAVPMEHVQQTCLYAGQKLRTLITVLLHTGMRPGEACIMRLSDLDRSTDPWLYRPGEHKTEHYGKDRTLFIGPKAQAALSSWLQQISGDLVFEGRQFGCHRTGKPVTEHSMQQSVWRINRKHCLEHWWLNQLRHTHATMIERKTGSARDAQIVLDHSDLRTTSRYIDADQQRKIELSRQFG